MERSRACTGSLTPQDPPAARENAAGSVAFRHLEGVGTPDAGISRLNSPACAHPCQHFADPLGGAHAGLGAIVDRYPFDVEPFHPLLHAGLSRRYIAVGTAV